MSTIIKLSDKNPVKFSYTNNLMFADLTPGIPNFYGDCFSEENSLFHRGYLEYLALAWERHYSVVLKPNDIWYMILNELATAIKKTPDKYASLFTTTPGEKQEIVVLTGNVETIDPSLVIEQLKSRVPSDINAFLPEFSVSTPMYTLASNVAFCDMVSPYYDYFTFLCDIPAIEIQGTEDDWHHILQSLTKLTALFEDPIKSYLLRCFISIHAILKAIKTQDADFFRTMVKLTPCGSGHQFDMNGFI